MALENPSGTAGVCRGKAGGLRAEDGEGEEVNEPETTSWCLWKTQLWSDAIKHVDVGPCLPARAP